MHIVNHYIYNLATSHQSTSMLTNQRCFITVQLHKLCYGGLATV